ncbi:DUF4397 domain-containing protein [Aliidiomarina haloalkalitolerans]|uniref:DUF4397 domain-containing protein n=1 Tax=Aliidiomarina haloalkalitolerans TaxID=859059 RepID=A0A432VVL3_9GAMM|nr:DUF4397 domain-containing protein [Aliidiomarina haloalkalitolerans]RUO20598.1 hypothetical protein CWE06_04615 [Aliidiomarina haloalkalitolerans]
MNRTTKLVGASLATLLLAACNSSSSPTQLDPNPPSPPPPPPPVGEFELRVHHASADAPAVNITVNGGNFLENVDYQVSSGLAVVDEGTYEVGVDAILADGSTATVIGPLSLDLEADTRYDVFALGRVDDETLEPFIVANPIADIGSGNARLQVLHGVPVDLTVDVYLTAFDADLSAEQPAATLSYQDYTGQVEVAAGDYQIRITVAGDADAVVFDSGEVTFPAGADLFVTATPSVGANSANRPIALLVADGEGSAVLHSVDAGADARVVHAVADAPAVDVLVNDDAVLTEVPFLAFSDYLNVPAGEYNIKVNAAGTDVTVIDADLELANAAQYTVLAVGELGGDGISPAVLVDVNRRITTEAIVRIVHASPAAGPVDIYVTATDDISEAEPAFGGVDFDASDLQATGNVALLPGEYYVTVTLAGTKDAAIGPILLNLLGGGIYTAVAVDATAGGLPPQLILLDDFVVEE